eukprot:14321057-Alexandrium_andersonii.AAC.1
MAVGRASPGRRWRSHTPQRSARAAARAAVLPRCSASILTNAFEGCPRFTWSLRKACSTAASTRAPGKVIS